MRTVPVKYSAGPLPEGCDPLFLISMRGLSPAAPAKEEVNPDGSGCQDNHRQRRLMGVPEHVLPLLAGVPAEQHKTGGPEKRAEIGERGENPVLEPGGAR